MELRNYFQEKTADRCEGIAYPITQGEAATSLSHLPNNDNSYAESYLFRKVR